MRELRAASGLMAAASVAAAAQGPAVASPEAEGRVESILGRMTLEEKVDLLGGVDDFYIRGIPRLGVPRFRLADGPLGVRNDGPATAFAAGIALAATWNSGLAGEVGTELGREARAKGVHVLLAPGVNICRAPIAGRGFEYFGEDPFLASRIAVGYVKGVQGQGVSATIKHFAGNNSEFDRNHTDSIIDERTLHEIYLPAFEAAVKEAQVGAVMDGYNLTNGAYMSENGQLNDELLKKGWGFRGILMSDWISTYDGVAAANGGLDLEMPSGAHMNRATLLPAIAQGKVALATVDDKVRRILRTAVAFGWLDRDAVDRSIPRFNPQGRGVALQAAREGMVLLKNEKGLLPLDKARPQTILLVGPGAHPAVTGGGGSSQVQPFSAVSFFEGLSHHPGSKASVIRTPGLPDLGELAKRTRFTTGGAPGLRAEYFAGPDLQGAPVLVRTEQHVEVGSASLPDYPAQTQSERWTSDYLAQKPGPHVLFVASSGDMGGLYRLSVDGALVLDSWKTPRALVDWTTLALDAGPHRIVLEHHGRPKWPGSRLLLGIARRDELVEPQAKLLAARADVVIVVAGFDGGTESEGADRTFRLPPGQDELIGEMTAANPKTIVVLLGGGAADLTAWVDRVPAVLQAWYPGEAGGTALAEILFGDSNPSGRLPVTFGRSLESYPSYQSYYPEPGTRRVVYREGIFVGYRGFERSGRKPLFPFGHGLSYTTFAYGNLTLTPAKTTDGRVSVSFDLTNTGSRAGAEVAQVYVAEAHPLAPRPPRELKGFVKVSLSPGETRRLTVELDRRALSWFDASTHEWRADPGDFEVLVGRSSERIELRGKLTLLATAQ